jgi:hypothetical protein
VLIAPTQGIRKFSWSPNFFCRALVWFRVGWLGPMEKAVGGQAPHLQETLEFHRVVMELHQTIRTLIYHATLAFNTGRMLSTNLFSD